MCCRPLNHPIPTHLSTIATLRENSSNFGQKCAVIDQHARLYLGPIAVIVANKDCYQGYLRAI